MTSLATNGQNDIYLSSDGNLAMARDLLAVTQECEHAMKAQLGEMPLALERGVPTMGTIWSEWNPVQFEAYARRILITVAHVKSVKNFTIMRLAGIATYTAEIQTDLIDTTTQITGDISDG